MAKEIPLSIQITAQPRLGDYGTKGALGACQINGVSHHIALLPVTGRDRQYPAESEEQYEAVCRFEDWSDGFQEIVAGRRRFVCVITPYAE